MRVLVIEILKKFLISDSYVKIVKVLILLCLKLVCLKYDLFLLLKYLKYFYIILVKYKI